MSGGSEGFQLVRFEMLCLVGVCEMFSDWEKKYTAPQGDTWDLILIMDNKNNETTQCLF